MRVYFVLLFTTNSILKDNDLLQFVIPHKHRPGTDLMTKLMLQDSRITNLILKTLIGTLTNIKALSPYQLKIIK
jgi:hypothetical protein